MKGKSIMENNIPSVDETELFDALDTGIDDMENGRVTPHEETMKIVIQRIEDYVLQNS